MNRKCKICNEIFPIKRFQISKTIGNKTYRRRECTSCTNDKAKVRRNKLKEKFTEYKKTLCCEMCGNTDHRVFEFHHKDPQTKDFDVSNMISMVLSWQNIQSEVDKCMCLCANCHRILHHDLNQS